MATIMTKNGIEFLMYTSHATPQKQFLKKGMQLMTFDRFTIAKATSLLLVFGIFKFHSTAI